jgi:glycosyltransferase involved in cell wall biosynthesis
MRISIITAVYKREATIGQAIASVACQTYADVEHWIIDGASPDGTMEVVQSHQNDGLYILCEPDNGIYDALNKGIQRATGDVIGVVHSDDFLAHEGVITKVAAAFADPTIDAVYGDLDYVSARDATSVVRHWQSGKYGPKKLSWGWMPPHPTLFLRRSVLERLGLYNTSYAIAADYDLILRYFGKGGVKSAYLPEVLVKMRVGGESNRSLKNLLLKACEDYRALRSNDIGGLGALLIKNLRKLPQFVLKAKPSMRQV